MGRVTSRYRVLRLDDGVGAHRPDSLAAEEPLEIRVGGRPLTVTMRTPGDDFDLARGFLVSEFTHLQDQFRREASAWVAAGQLRYKEDIVPGLAKAPEAFIGLLEGRNFGKLIIRVAS